MILDWLCYRLLMALPHWIGANPYTRFGRFCLSRAGNWEYRDERNPTR